MLTGKDLGDAIREAIRLKKASGAISDNRPLAVFFRPEFDDGKILSKKLGAAY